MRPTAFLALSVAMITAPAFAELPAPVSTALTHEAKMCRDMGGKPVKPGAAAVLSGDVNGDGKVDYLMDAGSTPCQGATTSCGSGGCSLTLWLSGPHGLKRAWDGLGINPTLGAGVVSYDNRSGTQRLRIKGQSVR